LIAAVIGLWFRQMSGSSQSDEGTMNHTNCRLGNVTGDNSFRVIGYGEETLFWMTYSTKAEAEEAYRLMDAALKGARVAFAPPVR
jgi:hypothetical protein